MPLGEFTKQLAQQAILSATAKEPAPKEAAAPVAQAENVGATIAGQVAAMQKALKEDEELALYLHTGADRMRVMEIFLPSPRVAVLSGVDESGFARVIAAVETLKLVARVQKVKAGEKARRVALVTGKG
jgi:hypothetical protein